MTPSLDIKQSNLDACSSRRPRAIGSSARGPRTLSRRSSTRPLRPGRPRAIGSSARVGRGLCSARVPQLVVALYAPPDVPARSAVQRAGPGLCPGAVPQLVVALYAPPGAPARLAVQRARAGVFVQREFRSWLWLIATTSEDCLSEEQRPPAPTTLATPTVPSQICGPSCSPSPRGNGGRTHGHGSRLARAQQSPGQSRPGRRSWRGCW